jgi:hypothetical protein
MVQSSPVEKQIIANSISAHEFGPLGLDLSVLNGYMRLSDSSDRDPL